MVEASACGFVVERPESHVVRGLEEHAHLVRKKKQARRGKQEEDGRGDY